MAYRPQSRVFTVAPATTPAVTLADLKQHLRIDHADEDSLVAQIAMAATGAVERGTQRLLEARQVVLKLAYLPAGTCPIEMPGGAVQGTPTMMVDGSPLTGLTVVGDSPARLVPATDWPVVTGQGYPVTITYTAGYTSIPAELVAAVKMIAGDLYKTRENGIEASLSQAIVNAEWLMAPLRIRPI